MSSEVRTPDGKLLPLAERRKIYSRRWYEKNKQWMHSAAKKRQAADPERFRAYKLAWAARNKEAEKLRAEIKNRRKYGHPEPTRPRPEHCECCGGKNRTRVLSLDHCHATGVFRGWLCDACNLGLGKLGDTLEAVERIAAYLKRVP